jgi:hypothetical protein
MATVGDDKMPSNNYTDIKPKESFAPPAEAPKKKIKAKEKKRTFGERIAENFLNLDKEQIRDRLLFDWLFPEIIATFDDILRMIFFGDRNGGPRSSRRSERGRSGYNSIYDERRRERERDDPTRQNFRHIKLVFYSREDAEEVLDDLRESLEESSGGFVTVKELYSLADMPTNYAMTSWGWFDLEDCIITRDRDDWILEMPKAEVVRR